MGATIGAEMNSSNHIKEISESLVRKKILSSVPRHSQRKLLDVSSQVDHQDGLKFAMPHGAFQQHLQTLGALLGSKLLIARAQAFRDAHAVLVTRKFENCGWQFSHQKPKKTTKTQANFESWFCPENCCLDLEWFPKLMIKKTKWLARRSLELGSKLCAATRLSVRLLPLHCFPEVCLQLPAPIPAIRCCQSLASSRWACLGRNDEHCSSARLFWFLWHTSLQIAVQLLDSMRTTLHRVASLRHTTPSAKSPLRSQDTQGLSLPASGSFRWLRQHLCTEIAQHPCHEHGARCNR